jgi:uncharacterized protein YigA (DUF484 family)
MSEQPEHQADNDEASRVADYLLQHPDFLDRHPQVLSALNVPHETGGAVSLVQRQVNTLRAQANKYRSQLEGLLEVARENDSLTARLHRLTLALIDASSLDDVLATLQDQLREQFQADAVELKLFSANELKQHAEQGEAGPAMFQDFMAKRRPSCGTLPRSQLDFLFGEQASDTASVALIPLNAGHLEGVLAIGSQDRERFHSGKGLDFLTRLGDIVSHALQAVTAPGA